MSRKEGFEDNSEVTEFAIAFPEELIVKGDGNSDVVLRALGTSEEAIDKLKEGIEDLTGAELREIGEDRISKKTFGFSKWNAPWNPDGPQPNWGYNPPENTDPSLN